MNCIFSNEDCSGDLKYRMPLAAVERSAVLCEYHWTVRKDDVRIAASTGCKCWEGYERVPGKKPCAPGSCKKSAVEAGKVKDLVKRVTEPVTRPVNKVIDGFVDRVVDLAEDPDGLLTKMDDGLTRVEDAISDKANEFIRKFRSQGSRNDGLVDALKEVLGNAFSMYVLTHGAHWNVVGNDFAQYHELFETIYEDVYDSIDPLAENIRKLEGDAPGSLSQFEELDGLKEAPLFESSEQSLAQDVLNANRVVLESLDKAFKVADETNEQGIANFLAERIDMHQKWQWQLTSSIGENNE